MFARKPAFLCSTYPSLFSVSSKSQTSSSSPTSQRRIDSTRPRAIVCTRCRAIQRRRGYATIAGDDAEPLKKPEIRAHEWPKPPKGHSHPTPYQIFSMKMNAPYTKARYYELVKLYHPDLSKQIHDSSSQSSVSPKTRMERYRLIVAAHSILSDPTKRTAYDRFGAGWNGRADFPSSASTSSSSTSQPGPFTSSWTSPDSSDPIWSNATWEDWERFYDRKEREANGESSSSSARPVPLYMSNASFLALVAILAMVGSSLNYNRAQDAGTYFVEQRDLVHDRAAKELRKVRQEMATVKGRDERIQWFIRQREATMGVMAGTDVEAFRDEKAERLLGAEREVCRSEAVGEQES